MDNLPHINDSESLTSSAAGSGPEYAAGAPSGQTEAASAANTTQHAQEILANSSSPYALSDDFYALKWQNKGPEQPGA